MKNSNQKNKNIFGSDTYDFNTSTLLMITTIKEIEKENNFPVEITRKGITFGSLLQFFFFEGEEKPPGDSHAFLQNLGGITT